MEEEKKGTEAKPLEYYVGVLFATTIKKMLKARSPFKEKIIRTAELTVSNQIKQIHGQVGLNEWNNSAGIKRIELLKKYGFRLSPHQIGLYHKAHQLLNRLTELQRRARGETDQRLKELYRDAIISAEDKGLSSRKFLELNKQINLVRIQKAEKLLQLRKEKRKEKMPPKIHRER
ncbi:MAG: hypothetical protein AB1467_00805 [Candidatus Diapherotrites archaeon]